MSKVALSGNASGTGTFTIASPNSNTDRTLTLPDATGTFVTKASTYIAPVELGSGTADNTTFLRGDNTWQTINTTPTTDQVLTATAGASAGAVGTYGWLYITATNTTITLGSTRAGSGLVWTSIYTNPSSGAPWTLGGSGSPAGTWRCMGHISAYDNANNRGTSLWLRIS